MTRAHQLHTTCAEHTFHVPVMGIGFTLDTALRIARYGISSVISLVDDYLVEQAREHYCGVFGEPYVPITDDDEDPRANRITAYLNLVDKYVRIGTDQLRQSSFEDPKGIRRYFELLPDGNPLKHEYLAMLALDDEDQKAQRQAYLRGKVLPGEVDANVMTKLDRTIGPKGDALPNDRSDALAALRGFANSTLESSIVLSAGMNPRLYQYLPHFQDFLPDENGRLKKTIILKVSDYRSVSIQGKYLAKRGIWISEYRLESGLNCGGHAFPTDGLLMGPILEEFRREREALHEQLYKLYCEALRSEEFVARGVGVPDKPPTMRLTTQGGVGTPAEHEFLFRQYGVDSVGWASPFLLVPEVTSVDEGTRAKLEQARPEDVRLSRGSPMGVRYWLLTTCDSDETRQKRVDNGKPGSPCPKGLIRLSQEFGKAPLCTAARGYQKQKIRTLGEDAALAPKVHRLVVAATVAPTCICHDLGGSFKIRTGIDPDALPNICPGPNVTYFGETATLDAMVGHIYGRGTLLGKRERRCFLINELRLYVDYLREQLLLADTPLSGHRPRVLKKMRQNLAEGIEYYRELAREGDPLLDEAFRTDLETLAQELANIDCPEGLADKDVDTLVVAVDAGWREPQADSTEAAAPPPEPRANASASAQ